MTLHLIDFKYSMWFISRKNIFDFFSLVFCGSLWDLSSPSPQNYSLVTSFRMKTFEICSDLGDPSLIHLLSPNYQYLRVVDSFGMTIG